MKTGFSPVGASEDPNNTSSGSYGTPEPDAKRMLTERGGVTTQPVTSVPLACAVARIRQAFVSSHQPREWPMMLKAFLRFQCPLRPAPC